MKTMTHRVVAAVILSMVVGIGGGGCGYSASSLLPEGIERIAVDIFENDTFYREIEFSLARELATEFNHRGRYRIARRRNADAALSGRIVSVRRPTLVETDEDFVSEQAVIVTADIVLTRLSDQAVIEQGQVRTRTEFVVERGETLSTAFAEAMHDLAEQIVNRLEAGSFLRTHGHTSRDAKPSVRGVGVDVHGRPVKERIRSSR